MSFDPFESSTTAVPKSSSNDSCQRVTIPHIPELFAQDYLDKILGQSLARAPESEGNPNILKEPKNAFMAALREEGNRARTWKNAPVFTSTLNPVLDAFTTINGNTSGDQIHQLLTESWAESPEKTLRVIWNLRSIHDGTSERLARSIHDCKIQALPYSSLGQASKMNFYRAFGWLYSNHPKTAIGNLQLLVDRVIEKKTKTQEGRQRLKVL